jgi:hypothetical protein
MNWLNKNGEDIIKILIVTVSFIVVIYMAASQNPEMNWPLKLAGFFAIPYVTIKLLFPKTSDK